MIVAANQCLPGLQLYPMCTTCAWVRVLSVADVLSRRLDREEIEGANSNSDPVA